MKPEIRNKISSARKGQKRNLSPETRFKMGAGNRGRSLKKIPVELQNKVDALNAILPPDKVALPLSQGLTTVIDKSDLPRVKALGSLQVRFPKKGKPYAYYSIWGGGKNHGHSLARFLLGLEKGDRRTSDHKQHFGQDGLMPESTLINCKVWNGEQHLRIASVSQNNCNARKQSRELSSRFKGVSIWRPNGYEYYRAQITHIVDGVSRTVYLGVFPFTDEGEKLAALQYNYFSKLFHGDSALLNEIED